MFGEVNNNAAKPQLERRRERGIGANFSVGRWLATELKSAEAKKRQIGGK